MASLTASSVVREVAEQDSLWANLGVPSGILERIAATAPALKPAAVSAPP